MKEVELAQIKDMMKEMEYLKKQIKSAGEQLTITSDSVRGSSPFYPYIEHTIIITGIDDKNLKDHVKQLQLTLRDKIQAIMDKVSIAQRYIETIKDVDTRIILQCRFINNMTWEEIERDMNISWTTAHRKYRKWRDKQ